MNKAEIFFQSMGFAKLFSLEQNFSLKIAAQVIEIWRKLQQLRWGTNKKCALLPSLQRLGWSSGYPNFSTRGASESKTVFWLLWRSKEPQTIDKPWLFVFSLNNVQIFFTVWRGTDVSQSQWQKEVSKARWSPLFSISHPTSCCVLMPQATQLLQLQGFEQSLKLQNRISVEERFQKTAL